jgi:hypothetical protein
VPHFFQYTFWIACSDGAFTWLLTMTERTGVEGQVCEHLRGLCLRQAMIHHPVEVIRDLRDVAGGDERTDGHQAPVPRRQGRTYQRAWKSTSLVYCTTPGATGPTSCSTRAPRCASAAASMGRIAPDASEWHEIQFLCSADLVELVARPRRHRRASFVIPVAMTAFSVARAALAIFTPIPQPAPVINQTLLMIVSFYSALNPAWYCSSLTFSIHSPTVPSRCS